MQTDEAIEEIRRVRHEISEEFGHDTQALLDHYRSLEKRYQHRMLKTESVRTVDQKKAKPQRGRRRQETGNRKKRREPLTPDS